MNHQNIVTTNQPVQQQFSGIQSMPPIFDEHDPRYKCCCQSIHVKTGAMIIGIVELVGAFFSFVGATVHATAGSVNQSQVSASGIWSG